MPQIKKWVLDMDDTLAMFNQEKNALERFSTEKGFFTILKASKLTKWLKQQIANNNISANNIYIVSASPNDNADDDKAKWLKDNLPMIPQSNILFTRLGQNKAHSFIDTYKITDLSNYVLVDDYTTNLLQWCASGGRALKYINEYNNTTQHYKQYDIVSLSVKNNKLFFN